MVKRVLRYLKGMLEKGLAYYDATNGMSGYADANFISDVIDRKSTSGLIVCMYEDLIIWSLHKQGCTATSSTEAEYIAMSESTKEILFLNRLASEVCKFSNQLFYIKIIYLQLH